MDDSSRVSPEARFRQHNRHLPLSKVCGNAGKSQVLHVHRRRHSIHGILARPRISRSLIKPLIVNFAQNDPLTEVIQMTCKVKPTPKGMTVSYPKETVMDHLSSHCRQYGRPRDALLSQTLIVFVQDFRIVKLEVF